jgi:uncharacterized protein (TIGR02300 family)
VAKAELGEKQLCPNCGSKFYDLMKRPAHCPKCHTEFDPGDETVKLKRVKTTRTPTYEADYEDDEAPRRAPETEEADEEVEEAPELDEAADEPATLADDGDEDDTTTGDPLPEGFSEDEGDIDTEEGGSDDEDAPILDLDEDEDFSDDEIEVGGEDTDEER